MAEKMQKEYQSIFDHEYFFHGIHADRLVALTSQFGKSASMKLLPRNVDVFMIAPVIGFIYGKRAALDNSQPDRTQKRLDKAFRFMGTPQAEPDEKRFEEYMRGGIDVLYEKLVSPGQNYEKNLISFLEEFNERYLATGEEDVNLVDVAHSI